MSDRELLELAAKAAGYTLEKTLPGYPLWVERVGIWNPLTDDGDALRLAVRLGLEVDIGEECVVTFKRKSAGMIEEFANRNSDIYAATRRAIVRAAAEIGRTL